MLINIPKKYSFKKIWKHFWVKLEIKVIKQNIFFVHFAVNNTIDVVLNLCILYNFKLFM